MKKTAVVVALAGLMSVGAVQAAQVNGFANGFTVEDIGGGTVENPTPANVTTTGNNFTMLDSAGHLVGGATNVLMTWDGTVFTSSSDYTGPGTITNISLSSTTPFFGLNWTAHDIQVFAPGSYNFDTKIESGGGGPALALNIGPNQLGAHMLFDWNGNFNIDVGVVWDANGIFAGPEKGGGTTAWNSVSVDGNGNGVPGIPMVDGPFVGFNANFNINGITPTSVPVPAAVWLFGSGLLGLTGVACRRKIGRSVSPTA